MNRRALLAIEIASPLLVLIALTLWTYSTDSYYFPPVPDVATMFAQTWLSDRLVSDLLPSLGRMAVAYLLCVVGGVGLGFVLAASRRLTLLLTPTLEFLRALPGPAMIPVGMLLFGLGDTMKIVIIAVGAVWPILLNTIDGVRGVDKALLHMARVYHLPRSAILGRIVFRAASPQILAGMRVSLSLTIIMMVVSEMVGSTNGIGFSVLQDQRRFAIPEMWAGIVLLGLIGYLANLVFLALEKRALFWVRADR